MNIQREISRKIPKLPPSYRGGGFPLFTAYGCVLLERDTGKTYVYTAVNLQTGRVETISRRSSPLTTSSVEAMAERIRNSKVAGAGQLEADRQFGEEIGLSKCRKMLHVMFNEILPQHGYNIRAEQISLAEHILGAIDRHNISLAEAEVGTGKTLAYLVPAILAKRGRLGGHWNMGLYTGSPFVDMTHMPIVVATSSISLQKAIVTDYIPELSKIMLQHGIIKSPLTAVLRKGREHYICTQNLQAHVQFEQNPKMKRILTGLLKPNAPIDLADVEGLTPYIKRRICVPDRCYINCPHRNSCAYLKFRKYAQSPEIDIQVCNHNYLLADILRRADNQRPLIPNYQSIVIDEAHKFLPAAQTMYGTELSSLTIPELREGMNLLGFKYDEAGRLARTKARKLDSEGKRLFRDLVPLDDSDDESTRRTVEAGASSRRHLRNVREISGELIELLSSEQVIGNSAGLKSQLVWDLQQLHAQVAALARHNELIYWLEVEGSESKLCAIPKELDKRLYRDIWGRGIATVLTSGTLSSNGDFTHIKRTLGLERVGSKLVETCKPSPFNHRENALMYVSENVPFPEKRDPDYISALADEVERLVRASHGHAAVLFTSYDAMGRVYSILGKRDLPYPLMRLEKSNSGAIERFKNSGNGVLFASGALWEGIDIPGDALSLLIIVKLPFAVPDPIGEYEQTLYKDMAEYKRCVIVPEMLVKLKQGFGRLIRTETDTGVVAILDSRAGTHGAYRERVLNALPDCRTTADIKDIADFIREKKAADYFK